MRTILCWAGIPVLVALAWSADVTTPAKKTATPPKKTATKAPAKKGATKAPASAAKRKSAPSKAGPRTAASRRGKKGPPAKRVTWRNRQLAPTPQRYKEIQDALAAKGYLKPEDANGAWNQASVDALKRFQAGQNLDSTGKINSLSLIALGLGPKRETPPPKPPAEAPPAP
ncbi:MAG: peptidoglycan-binding protein [Bryobacteraceae bacterium]